jgi:retron-type reverse transcriptase
MARTSSNARAHLGAECILEFDLKDFFDTITAKRVFHALIKNGLSEKQARYITNISTRYGVTPQGAPTSPAISNIVCKPLDRFLHSLCRKKECIYTRYADDITVSGNPEALRELKPLIERYIRRYGFQINEAKTCVAYKGSSPQSVTGILINSGDRLSVSYTKNVQNFRAMLYIIENRIAKGELRTFDELEAQHASINSLKGYANFISTANPRYGKYKEQVNRIEKLLKEMV